MTLSSLVAEAAARTPEAFAVSAPDGRMTYRALDEAANRIGRALQSMNVNPGDRVGLWLEKSTRGVAAMQAALRLGAPYVPIDPQSPAPRALSILRDGGIRVVVTTADRAPAVAGHATPLLLDGALDAYSSAPIDLPTADEGGIAYVLYTSGSTGTPKGVCISHGNALAFVDWCVAEMRLAATDRFSNHAPFHFDLSVLDLYGAFRAGGEVVIIPEGASYAPQRLVDLLHDERITVWYSVPSALVLMMQHGALCERGPGRVRVLNFAGEVFPLPALRRLRRAFAPSVRFLNLYGPTETNVCTFHEVAGDIPEEQVQPIPIGRACSGDRVWARRPDGAEAGVGEEGELFVEGPTVMIGYWGRPPQVGPYPTGDLVQLRPDGAYTYVGRRDHMVKVRGFRVELGDVEAVLMAHPALREVAVTVAGEGASARLVAFVATHDGHPLPLLAVKQHCAAHLPRYMIVDRVRHVDALPRTGNGKVDRRRLAELLAAD